LWNHDKKSPFTGQRNRKGVQYAREEANSAASVSCLIGGAKRDRTADLLNAIQCNWQEN